MRRIANALLLTLAAFGVAGIGALLWLGAGGTSSRPEPGRIETGVARILRQIATPASTRTQPNPLPANPDVIASGLAHFADHCALCHANDGSGNTAIGQGLSPRAPDMRAAATQSLSDGELFAIIADGIRFTGMPAWGDGSEESVRQTWELVHFIRHLPRLSESEIQQMEDLNPRSPEEFREQEEIRRFLEGQPPAAPPSNGQP